MPHAKRLGCCLGVLLCAAGFAADWPQFLGPQRNCTSSETELLQSWGEKGPPMLWQKDVGEGYSAPVVAGERLILFHRVGDEEIVECLDAASGKPIWKHRDPTRYRDPLGKGDGPRSTPLIAGERVYTLSPGGRLLSLKLANGEKVWQRELLKHYNVPRSYFGVGTSPILESGRVLVNVGARDAGIVAFDKDNGKEVWKATGDGASYSSPMAATIDGVRHVLFFTRQGIVSLDPATGNVRFSKRWRSRMDASVNAAAPVVVGDSVFFSSCYDTGAILVRAKKDGIETLWSNDRSLSCHYSTPVYHDGYLYGFDGRQESGTEFRCVDVKNGKVHWSKEGFGCGSMILAEGNLIVLSEGGDLVLVECKSDKYREKARASVLTGPCRAHMALANGRLYARDNRKLVCLNLKK
ncbi:MAG TPA: PQQ-binding-like beta-propeller repeat protein [Gemmataceae bacterium]|nr:PQQ-binding-like beta-propeller repeat protein [Gemmataceae bacterium]